MKRGDSSLAITKPILQETIGSAEIFEPTKIDNFFVNKSLVAPNQETTQQTLPESINGGSQVFEPRLDRLAQYYLPPQQSEILPEWETASREQFRTLQKWEGYVISIGPETFRAKLVPLMGEGSDMEAEIYLEELDETDQALIEPGAVFYWSIGYLDRPSGRRRESIIRFRRLRTLTNHDLQTVEAQVAELRYLFNADGAT